MAKVQKSTDSSSLAEVDDPVEGPEGEDRLGPEEGKHVQLVHPAARQDHGQYVSHASSNLTTRSEPSRLK